MRLRGSRQARLQVSRQTRGRGRVLPFDFKFASSDRAASQLAGRAPGLPTSRGLPGAPRPRLCEKALAAAFENSWFDTFPQLGPGFCQDLWSPARSLSFVGGKHRPENKNFREKVNRAFPVRFLLSRQPRPGVGTCQAAAVSGRGSGGWATQNAIGGPHARMLAREARSLRPT